MRKAINISALLFLIWLILDTYSVLEKLMYFLLVGALPGTVTTVSPTYMLAITSGLIGLVVFESLARHFNVTRKIKKFFNMTTNRRARLPNRRFTRI